MPTFTSHLDLRATIPPRQDIPTTQASLPHPVSVFTALALKPSTFFRFPSRTDLSFLVFPLDPCTISFARFLAPLPSQVASVSRSQPHLASVSTLLLFPPPHPALPGTRQSWGWCLGPSFFPASTTGPRPSRAAQPSFLEISDLWPQVFCTLGKEPRRITAPWLLRRPPFSPTLLGDTQESLNLKSSHPTEMTVPPFWNFFINILFFVKFLCIFFFPARLGVGGTVV